MIQLDPQLPNYPVHIQVCRVTAVLVSPPWRGSSSSSAPGALLYVSFTEQLQSTTLVMRDREACLVTDPSGIGLPPGYYNCRLAGSYNGLPVYVAACCDVAASSTPTLSTNPDEVAVNSPVITLYGSNFDLTLGSNSVQFYQNGVAVGSPQTPVSGTTTSLVVPLPAGLALDAPVKAVVTSLGMPSANVQVGTVKSAPLLLNTGTTQSVDKFQTAILLYGNFVGDTTGFQVFFDNGAVGTVTAVNTAGTQATVLLTTLPANTGTLSAGLLVSGGPPAKPVSGATNANPISITSVGHGLVTGDTVYIYGAAGNTAANGSWTVTVTGTDTFTLQTSVGNGAYTGGGNYVVTSSTITSATNATPVAITATGDHGLSSGTKVAIADVYGNTTANGIRPVTVTGGNTFTLNGSIGNGVYSGTGGIWFPVVPVAEVTHPAVTPTTTAITTATTTVTITLTGGTATAANASVAFNLGAVGTVTSSSPTSITATFTTQPSAGTLTAAVTINGYTSPAVQVAVVTNTVSFDASGTWTATATSATVECWGTGADGVAGMRQGGGGGGYSKSVLTGLTIGNQHNIVIGGGSTIFYDDDAVTVLVKANDASLSNGGSVVGVVGTTTFAGGNGGSPDTGGGGGGASGSEDGNGATGGNGSGGTGGAGGVAGTNGGAGGAGGTEPGNGANGTAPGGGGGGASASGSAGTGATGRVKITL